MTASGGVVRHLVGLPHLYLIATHQRRLTTLADGSSAQNYHSRTTSLTTGWFSTNACGPGQHERETRCASSMEGYPQTLLDLARQCVKEGGGPYLTYCGLQSAERLA
ncbi:MAG: hypothetical protein IH986_02350 [Planctomycetes bacterium]|nr:hypothetical protein [Planctomycetota bacterium]